MSTVKVSVNLAAEDVLLLHTVSESTGKSMSEVFRHALGLERLAQTVREDPRKNLLVYHGDRAYRIPL